FVTWPKQQIVTQNAVDTAGGKPANPAAAPAGARAGLASRTNVVFSIPMLFYMGAASHLALPIPRSGATYWIVALAVMALVRLNPPHAAPNTATTTALGTVKGTLWFGFVLAAIFYVWFEVLRA